jgi:hypothetical protein
MSYPTRFQLLLVFAILIGSFCTVHGQGRGVNADRARAIEQADMDRLLMWAVPKDREPEAVRLSRFRKIKEDFKTLQSLNNKMMADAWMQDALDYSSIADMVSKIRGKANDLKDGLSLPASEHPEAASKTAEVSTVRQFRQELLLLDKTIMRFVNNPVFQAANTMDVNLAKEASADLEQVISLALDLKQNAQKLRKVTP